MENSYLQKIATRSGIISDSDNSGKNLLLPNSIHRYSSAEGISVIESSGSEIAYPISSSNTASVEPGVDNKSKHSIQHKSTLGAEAEVLKMNPVSANQDTDPEQRQSQNKQNISQKITKVSDDDFNSHQPMPDRLRLFDTIHRRKEINTTHTKMTRHGEQAVSDTTKEKRDISPTQVNKPVDVATNNRLQDSFIRSG